MRGRVARPWTVSTTSASKREHSDENFSGTPGGVIRLNNRTASNQTQQDSPPNDAVSARIAAIERGEPLPPLAPANGHEAPLEPKEESFE